MIVRVKKGNGETGFLEFLKLNVGSRHVGRGDILMLCGACIEKEYPEKVLDLKGKTGSSVCLGICLEREHMNSVGFKLSNLVRMKSPRKIIVLTVDGSPHCVQMHYIVEDVKRNFEGKFDTEHYVIEKGKLYRISEECVKISRHLSKIQKMKDETTT